MPFDGITTASVTKELSGLLVGAKIEKIYQPAPEELILLLHGNQKNVRLLVSAASTHARLHLIEQNVANPQNPPSFCMLLRKHLQNGRIRDFYQKDSERIVEMAVDSLDEMGYSVHKKLVIEIMGKHSNISLVDMDSGKILDSIKRISGDVNRYRQLLPGVLYLYPPARGKLPVWSVDSADKLKNLLCSQPMPEQKTKAPGSAGAAEKAKSGCQAVLGGQADSVAKIDTASRLIPEAASAFVDRLQGVSPFLASAICRLSGIDPKQPVSTLSDGEYALLYAAFSRILQVVSTGKQDNIVYCGADGAPVDFYPVDLRQRPESLAADSEAASAKNASPIASATCDHAARAASANNTAARAASISSNTASTALSANSSASPPDTSCKRFDTLSLALEYYYESKAASSHIRQKAADLIKVVRTALDKLYLKKKRLLADLEDASGNDRIRLLGELLTAGIYKVKQGDTSFEADNYYDGGTVSISLDPLLSPSENIQRYFKKYNKAKTAMKEKNIQLTETNADIAYLESVLTFMENTQDAGDLTDLRQELIENRYIRKKRSKNGLSKKDKPEKSGLKPYAYTTSDGFRLSVGRNNKQNDILTLKTASNKDLWFHTKEIPGSHVILFTEGKSPTETALREAASLAAWHSKARQSDNVPVDFVAVKHVRKPAGAKYGMVIYDHHQTLYVRPAEPGSTGA